MRRQASALCAVITLVAIILQYASGSSEIYTWDKAYPQSCECMETGVSGKDCTLFRCKCTCDITAGECDYGCCCDPDCSVDQIDRFKKLNECASEGYAPETETLCYSDVQLAKINPKEPLYGAPTAKRALDQALCVQKKNFAPRIDYYTDTGLQSKSIFSKRSGQKLYDYSNPQTYAILSEDDKYDKGDTIPAYSVVHNATYKYLLSSETSVNKKYIPFSENVWRLPANDFTGECNSFGNARFEEAFSTESCLKTVSYADLDNYCSNELSLGYLVHSLVLAESADLASSVFGTPGASNTVGVTLRSVKYVSSSSNLVVDMTKEINKYNGTYTSDLGNCNTRIFKGLQNDKGAGWAGYDLTKCTPFLTELLDFNTSTSNRGLTACISAVKEISYTVEHAATAAGTITTVYADVVLVDIYPTSSESDVTLTNSYSVAFTSADSSSVSDTNGNVFARPRSGNPGYLHGKPVILGQWNGSQVKVEYDEVGIQLPVSSRATPSSFPSTQCARSDTFKSLNWDYDTLTFGEDMTTSCSIPLSWSTLKDMCCEGTTSCLPDNSNPFSFEGLPIHFTNLSLGSFLSSPVALDYSAYIGQYGNSDPLDPSQWIKMALSTELSNLRNSKSWDGARGVCKGMPTGLHFKFLLVKSGEKYNPQMKIVAADIEMTTSDWRMRVPASDRSTTQNFHLATTISFVQKNDQAYKGYVPPNPPALFNVPANIFYPFASNAASSKSSMISLVSIMIVTFLSSSVAILLASL